MGYSQVYTEAGIPIIWGEFHMPKEFANNRQELLAGIIYWSKTNGIKIGADVIFIKLAIDRW